MEKKDKIKNIYFFSGILVIFFLILFYFIKINVDTGNNFVIEERILGIIIFHNPFILALYILAAFVFFAKGLNMSRK